MIITKTPYRVSLLGGGSDYPEIYSQVGYGATLVGAINQFCYVTVRSFPPFFPKKNRAVWSQIELFDDIDLVENPVIRECLRYTGMRGVEIHHQGDLPAWSGMGTSSAFTVGLLNALYHLKGETPSRTRLAKEAILIERDLIHDTVGVQDQISTAHGGLSLIEIHGDGQIDTMSLGGPLLDSGDARTRELSSYMMLLFSGASRIASTVARSQVKEAEDKIPMYRELVELAHDGASVFDDPRRDLRDIGLLVERAWQIKRTLSGGISNSDLDQTHDDLIRAGAIGVKLLGAGAGGFFLAVADGREQNAIREGMLNGSIQRMLEIPFNFYANGSQVVYAPA